MRISGQQRTELTRFRLHNRMQWSFIDRTTRTFFMSGPADQILLVLAEVDCHYIKASRARDSRRELSAEAHQAGPGSCSWSSMSAHKGGRWVADPAMRLSRRLCSLHRRGEVKLAYSTDGSVGLAARRERPTYRQLGTRWSRGV